MAMRLVVAVVLAWVALPAVAYADKTFSQRLPFPMDEQGDITIVANSILTCLDDPGGVCANARSGTATTTADNNNNNRTMTWINVDEDRATFNASSADLTLPAGATVLWAGLYFVGD